MSEVFQGRDNFTLGQIVIPGTHDTGTSTIDCFSPFERGGEDAEIFQWPGLNAILTVLGSSLPCFIAGLAKTQDHAVAEQLDDGIRFLDFRINVDLDESFVLTHTMEGDPLDDTLYDLAHFAAHHPKEIILVEVGKVPTSYDYLDALNNMMSFYLGDYILPEIVGQSLTTLKIEEVWESGKNIILIMKDDTYADSSSIYWSTGEHIDNNWSDTGDKDELVTDQRDGLDPRLPATLTKTSLIMTYDGGALSLRDMAGWIEDYSRTYIPRWIDEGLSPNIVIVDFYEDTEVVTVAIEENLEMEPWEWLNYGMPGSAGHHDWETLEIHTSDEESIPDHVVGIEPSFVEMRRVTDQANVNTTGDEFILNTLYGGKVLSTSANEASGNYEIRFHFGWTPWINNGTAGGPGDYEAHVEYTGWTNPNADFAGQMPERHPTGVQCRAVDYPDVVFTHESPTNEDGWIEGDLGDGQTRLFWCKTGYGYKCLNNTNTSAGYSSCIDVEVRYDFGYEPICDGNMLDGMDNGVCDGSAGEVTFRHRWNTNLCLNVAGHENFSAGDNVNLYPCAQAYVEALTFNLVTGKVQLAEDSDLCLDAVGDSDGAAGANIQLGECDSVSETWSFDEASGHFQAGWDPSLCLGVAGTNPTSAKNVVLSSCDDPLDQRIN